MDILLIITTVVIALIMFGVSFYLLALYCHPEDKGVGTSIGSKIIVVLGLGMSWCQLLLIPLDVSNSNTNSGINMELLYAVVYIVILVFVAVIAPFTIFYYESDEEDPQGRRICWSTIFTFISATVWCMLIFISYVWLSKYDFTSSGVHYAGQISAPLYVMVCLSLAGWVLLALFGGIGLIALPVQLIQEFTHRPKKLTADQARQKKKSIEQSSSTLIQLGETLKNQNETLNKQESGWWSKRKQGNKVNKLFEEYKQKVIELQEKYEIFEQELKIDSVNPVVYYISLLLGILFLLLSITWVIQMQTIMHFLIINQYGDLCSMFNVVFRPDGSPVLEFLDGLFVSLNKQSLDFVSTGMFGVLTIYLLWCVQKGNVSFGLRIPFIMSFHPMKKNETYLNSFLFNVNLMLLASVATTQLTVFSFSKYCASTYLSKQFFYINQLPLFGFLYQKRVFPICMMIILMIKAIGAVVSQLLRNRKLKKLEQKK